MTNSVFEHHNNHDAAAGAKDYEDDDDEFQYSGTSFLLPKRGISSHQQTLTNLI
jgi:hypothetical protein